MSPAALDILTESYKRYTSTLDTHFSFYPSGNKLLYQIEGTRQLSHDGYIENVSDFVFAQRFPIPSLIEFNITEKGIEYMRLCGKL